MAAHARLGPSGADRWARCPGAPEAEAMEPDEETEWAAEGTIAHKVFELCLTYGMDASDFYGSTFTQGKFKFKVGDEMVEALQPIIDDVLDMPGRHFYENRVNLSRWMPGQFGTLDVGIMQVRRGTIVIRDLKYGKGLPVRAENNYQLMIYAAGFWDDYVKAIWPRNEPKPKFRIIIDQPRNDGGGGDWTVSYDDLMDFMDGIEKAAEKTYPKYWRDGVVPRIAGDKQCSYCKAAVNGHCRTYDEWNLAKFGAKFESFSSDEDAAAVKLPEKMPADVRARIIDMGPALNQWLKRLHADHINDIMAGLPGGGKKLIAGRKGLRKWVDEKAVEKWLDEVLPAHADIYKPQEIISPAQAQKLLGKGAKEKLKPFVVQGQGKPVLVAEDDARPALETYNEKFEDFGEEED